MTKKKPFGKIIFKRLLDPSGSAGVFLFALKHIYKVSALPAAMVGCFKHLFHFF